MECEAMYMWSLSGLVGAFLDLTISYFLLCASAMAFMASKFLGFFGLCLPCPCNGLFGITKPSNDYCFEKFLIHYPTEKVSNVQFSVKKRFPFNELMFGKEGNGDFVEMEGEASCSSASDARKSRNDGGLKGKLIERNGYDFVREGRCDVKGKGLMMNQRPRRWIRRRRKGGVDCGKDSLVSSCDYPREDGGHLSSASSINKRGIGIVEDRISNLGNGFCAHCSCDMDDGKRRSSLFDEFLGENDEEKNLSSTEEAKDKSLLEMASNDNAKNTVEFWEQAFKEERAARSALYLELEKERSAAATAADEAMAMILRLQEEKGSFEMEARQYQRIIEEKSAYNADEMNILKEILVRREREKHFLEKEVQAYRQMINFANEQLPSDGGDMKETAKQALDFLLDPYGDPVLMLQHLSSSIDKNTLNGYNQTTLCHNNEDRKFQEKPMVSTSTELSISQEHYFPKKTISIIGEEENNTPTHDRNKTFQEVKDSRLSTSDKVQVHDIHVILDGSNLNQEDKSTLSPNAISEGKSKSNFPPESSTGIGLANIRDYPSSSNLSAQIDIHRSTSDITGGLHATKPRPKSKLSDTRRNSMSAMDIERLKIDHEVGWLRERLKVVQEGREKFNLSMEQQERQSIQLKLLEDISRQLQEIHQLTGSGKSVRRTSLPPPSLKIRRNM